MPADVEGAPAVVVMGACGCGKSTVGRLLAAQLGGAFADADDFHPASNIEKMRAGVGLSDEDRWPWLDVLRKLIHETGERDQPLVLACSALRRGYRDRLRDGERKVRFVYLQGSAELLAARLSGRSGHYAGEDLVASQLATLEEPGADEEALVMDIQMRPELLVNVATQWVSPKVSS